MPDILPFLFIIGGAIKILEVPIALLMYEWSWYAEWLTDLSILQIDKVLTAINYGSFMAVTIRSIKHNAVDKAVTLSTSIISLLNADFR